VRGAQPMLHRDGFYLGRTALGAVMNAGDLREQAFEIAFHQSAEGPTVAFGCWKADFDRDFDLVCGNKPGW